MSADLGNVLHEVDAAASGARGALPGAATRALVDRVAGVNPRLAGNLDKLTSRFTAGPVAEEPAGPTIDADAQVAYLNEHLFTDANHVGNGVYKIPAELACGAEDNGAAIDEDCAAQLAEIDPRIRTTRDGDSTAFVLQLGANHDEPLRLTLTHTSIAITVDLDDAQRVVIALAGPSDEAAPSVAVSGDITAKLEVLGTAKIRASLSLDRALSIKAAPAGKSLDGVDALVIASAKSEIFALTLDGTAKTGELAVALGETSFKAPQTEEGRFAIDLPGVTATASFAEGQPLSIKHIGLGNRTTSITIDGAPAATFNLNPDNGRALDATLTEDEAGVTTLTVTPKLDLRATFDHALLGDDAPVYDVTRVLLDGSLRSRGDDSPVEVVTGSLTVTTDPGTYGFVANAGQCVTSEEKTDSGSLETYTQWTVDACVK